MRGLMILIAAAMAVSTATADSSLRLAGVRHYEAPRDANHRAGLEAALERGRRTADKLRAHRGAAPQAMAHSVELKWPIREAITFGHPSVQAISNYLDQDDASGDSAIEDWNCSAPQARTYDGHNGLDVFLTPYSWYQMNQDSAIVVAAAPGIIVDKVGDQPETSCSIDNPVGENNLVMVEHADGSYGVYAHLRTGSLTEKPVGASVQYGEYLGVVGSSGYSTGPHLHFEVGFFEGNSWVPQDPYEGACNSINSESWWEDQPPYYVPAIVQIATHSAEPEQPPCPGVETPYYSNQFDAGDLIVFSIAFRDLLRDESASVTVRQPNGSIYTTTGYTHSSSDFIAGALVWFSTNLPGNAMPGEWSYEVAFQGNTLEHTFWVDSSPPAPSSIGAGNNRYNGLWYDPDLDGEGFNIVTTPQGTAIYFYGSDENGERLWLVSELFSQPFSQGTTHSIAMLESTGGVFARPIASGRGLDYWGELRLRFTACDAATATLVGNDGHKESSLVKIIGVPGSECVPEPETVHSKYSGLWYDPALEGEGFNLVVTAAGSILYYYGFDDDGDRLWMVSPPFDFSFADGASTQVDLLKATSGSYGAPVPSGQALQDWGSVTVTGDSCNAMRFELDTNEGDKTMNARRLVNVVGLGC